MNEEFKKELDKVFFEIEKIATTYYKEKLPHLEFCIKRVNLTRVLMAFTDRKRGLTSLYRHDFCLVQMHQLFRSDSNLFKTVIRDKMPSYAPDVTDWWSIPC